MKAEKVKVNHLKFVQNLYSLTAEASHESDVCDGQTFGSGDVTGLFDKIIRPTQSSLNKINHEKLRNQSNNFCDLEFLSELLFIRKLFHSSESFWENQIAKSFVEGSHFEEETLFHTSSLPGILWKLNTLGGW